MSINSSAEKVPTGYDLDCIFPIFQQLAGRPLQAPDRCVQLHTGPIATIMHSKEIILEGQVRIASICRLFLQPSKVQLSLTTAERSLFSVCEELYDSDYYTLVLDSEVAKQVVVRDHDGLFADNRIVPPNTLFCRYSYKRNGTLLLK